MNHIDPGLQFWNDRANLGITAGTNDFMLTEIEHRFIVGQVRRESRVLDIGCGNAMTLIKLVKDLDCRAVGFDFSEKMVEVARRMVFDAGLAEKIKILHRSVPPVTDEFGKFDHVISQRCLINLKTTEEQKQAVQSIEALLHSSGTYIMVECSMDGGNLTNEYRAKLSLPPIDPPWHNLFFNETDVASWQTERFRIKKLRHISSTYNFLSRVVYAGLAAKTGEELLYDSEINKLSLMLPQESGQFGPVKAWIWKKLMGGLDATHAHLDLTSP